MMRASILFGAILFGLGVSPANSDGGVDTKSAKCEALLRSVDQMRAASRQMLAQVEQERERAESLAASLDPEHRHALSDYLQNQEARLKSVFDGLQAVNCPTGSRGGGAAPPPQ